MLSLRNVVKNPSASRSDDDEVEKASPKAVMNTSNLLHSISEESQISAKEKKHKDNDRSRLRPHQRPNSMSEIPAEK